MEQVLENTFILEVGRLMNNVPSIETGYEFAYKRFYKPTHRYGMYLLKDAFTIDNIVQEAFLKLWDYKEQMTSLLHVSRFLKQNVRWECHAHFRNPVSRFHRRFTYLDAIADCDYTCGLPEEQGTDERGAITESQLKVITDMLPFLPSGRDKTFMKLYYEDGLSGKQIADRYEMHVSAVHLELRRGVSKLKAMIVKPQQVFAVSDAAAMDTGSSKAPVVESCQQIWLYNVEGLNKEQSQIYRLRMESKYGFDRISDYLSLPQAYVQQQYIKAWQVVNLQKKKSGSTTGTNNKLLSTSIITGNQHKRIQTTFLIA